MMLREQIAIMIPSDRIQIENKQNQMLYKGFVACLGYEDIDLDVKVAEVGITTEVYKRRKITSWQDTILPREPEPIERDPESYRFVDLSFDVAIKIVVDIKKEDC